MAGGVSEGGEPGPPRHCGDTAGTPRGRLPGAAPGLLSSRVSDSCDSADCRESQKSAELKGTHQDLCTPAPGPAQDSPRVTESLRALSKRFLHSVRLVQ